MTKPLLILFYIKVLFIFVQTIPKIEGQATTASLAEHCYDPKNLQQNPLKTSSVIRAVLLSDDVHWMIGNCRRLFALY